MAGYILIHFSQFLYAQLPNCRGVQSTDCATAHAARWLLKTRHSFVLTVIYSKDAVAAGACPTDQWRS